jgi:hypothetical protein
MPKYAQISVVAPNCPKCPCATHVRRVRRTKCPAKCPWCDAHQMPSAAHQMPRKMPWCDAHQMPKNALVRRTQYMRLRQMPSKMNKMPAQQNAQNALVRRRRTKCASSFKCDLVQPIYIIPPSAAYIYNPTWVFRFSWV